MIRVENASGNLIRLIRKDQSMLLSTREAIDLGIKIDNTIACKCKIISCQKTIPHEDMLSDSLCDGCQKARDNYVDSNPTVIKAHNEYRAAEKVLQTAHKKYVEAEVQAEKDWERTMNEQMPDGN